MNLSKELTTLTPLSKYLAIALCILLLMLGFYLATKYQQTVFQSTVPLTRNFPPATTTPTSGITMQPTIAAQYYVTPTVIPSPRQGWSTYVDKNNLYSISFPQSWSVEVQGNGYESTKLWVRLYFFENRQQYMLEVGQGGRGVTGTDNIEETRETYGGKVFDKKIFSHAGKPFLISVAPTDRDTELTYFNHIGIELPSTNPSKYIQIFNQILSTLTFIK